MPRIVKPLVDTKIRNAKPKDKEYSLSDGNGLFLRVKPNGTKSWIFNYLRPYSKRRSNISLGVYDSVSLESARLVASQFRKQLKDNIDPKEFRDSKQQENTVTFFVVAKKWFAIKKNKFTEKHANKVWRSLELHVFPFLKDIPIHQLRAPHLIKALDGLSQRQAHDQISRVIQRSNKVMAYAVNVGIIDHNPFLGVKEAFETAERQNMATIRPEDLPRLMVAIKTANITHTTRQLILWQLHTMVRPGEAAATKWAEIDFDNKKWVIPPERMKKRREHQIPLTPEALAILEDMALVSGQGRSVYVFPSVKDIAKSANSQAANMALKRMGFKGELVSHGLRSIASTALNEHGFDADVIEACLAHYDKSTTRAAYNRAEYFERRKPLMAWWSNLIIASS